MKIEPNMLGISFVEISSFSTYIITVLEFLNFLTIRELSFLAVSYKKYVSSARRKWTILTVTDLNTGPWPV